ncbi:DUF4326 domain-containing protein [Runella salmonicolor]|uniref:DUF4326 domain-containing protein n=1 Tax=Runella salmonicolor TaxID=2950278 RepID=A0ABT1FT03_9BACT|nr:DUF4326 domain-containing protein [Runella salmonicolor]MCP1384851.1 DUF4326 domain-containing protein [Runella salmonicolor]
MKRIQRKRTKGYRIPENAVSITRPGQWGNPVKLVGDMIYIDASHRRAVMDKWVCLCHGTPEDVVDIYRYLVGMTDEIRDDIKGNFDIDTHQEMFAKKDFTPLIGKDLACFCPLGAPCHGDVLIQKLIQLIVT